MTDQRNDYRTGCLLDHVYFEKYYKMIRYDESIIKSTDLSKQQVLVADPKSIQQIEFTENLDWAGRTAMYIVIEEVKKVF